MRHSTLVLATALAFVASERAHAGCGRLLNVIGDVKVGKAGKSPSPAANDSQVCEGDKVVTGKDSRARAEMDDKNVLHFSPDTSVVIESYQPKKVSLNVLGGKLRSDVAAQNKYGQDGKVFQVKTKSAVAGVRGTEFLTSYQPSTNKTEIITFSGKVDVGLPSAAGQMESAVQVGAGQRTEAAGGQPPAPPRVVPASELRQIYSSSQAGPPSPSAPPPPAAPAPGPDKKKDDAKQDPSAGPANGSSDNRKNDPKDGGPRNAGPPPSDSGSGNANARQPEGRPQDGQAGAPPAGAPSGPGKSPVGSAPPSMVGGPDGPRMDGPRPDGPRLDGPGRGPASAPPGFPGGNSMVGAGEARGDVKIRPPDVKIDVPSAIVPNVPTQLPVSYVPPQQVTDVQNNSGPTRLKISICLPGGC